MRDQDLESQRYKELNDKLDKLSKVFLVNQKAVNYVGEADYDQQGYHEGVCEDVQRMQEEVNYLGNQNNYQGGYQNNFQQGYQNRPFTQNYGNNNLSYRSNNVENPKDQYYPPRAPQGNQFQPRPYGNPSQPQNSPWKSQGGAQGQNQLNVPTNDWKMRPMGQPKPNVYPQASEQDDMKSMMRQIMEGQAKGQQQLTERMEKLERKIDSNHEEAQAKFEDVYSHLKMLDNQIAQVASTSKRPMGTLPGKPEANPKEYVNVIDIKSRNEQPSDNISGDISGLSEVLVMNVDKNNEENRAETEEINKGMVDAELQTATTTKTPFIPPPYEPKLPFPGRFKKELLEKSRAKFDKLMTETKFTLPVVETLLKNPNLAKPLRDALMEKEKEFKRQKMAINEKNNIIQKESITSKVEDPGKFTLPCTLGSLTFSSCLCDLGVSINLMPLSIAKKLGFTRFKECKISLVLADRSVRQPVGKLEDLPVEVGGFTITTDFVVLGMEEEPKDPLVFGRPFLATVGALIDVKSGKINLQLGDEVLKFDINKEIRKPTTEGQAFGIEELDALAGKPPEEICVVNPVQKGSLAVKKRKYGSLDVERKRDKNMLNWLKSYNGKAGLFELKQGVHSIKTEVISKEEAERHDDRSELKALKTAQTHPPTDSKPPRAGIGTSHKKGKPNQEKEKSIHQMGKVIQRLKDDGNEFTVKGGQRLKPHIAKDANGEKTVVSLHVLPPA